MSPGGEPRPYARRYCVPSPDVTNKADFLRESRRRGLTGIRMQSGASLESEQSSVKAGDGASPGTDKKIKALEKKLEKANAKLEKRTQKIAELREKIGAASGK